MSFPFIYYVIKFCHYAKFSSGALTHSYEDNSQYNLSVGTRSFKDIFVGRLSLFITGKTMGPNNISLKAGHHYQRSSLYRSFTIAAIEVAKISASLAFFFIAGVMAIDGLRFRVLSRLLPNGVSSVSSILLSVSPEASVSHEGPFFQNLEGLPRLSFGIYQLQPGP